MTCRRDSSCRTAAIIVSLLFSGCVTVYQPLVGLQRPSVVDPRLANFEGLRLLVRCIPGDYLDAADAEALCRKTSALFRNQGAQVETAVPRDGYAGAGDEDAGKPDLVVDLKSRLLHHDDNPLLMVAYLLTFTIVPSVNEYSFAQDVTVRDPEGFLLASDTLQGRFIQYGGVGIWGVNWVLDVLVRPTEEELTSGGAERDFSRDFYAQLSQLVFNAQVRTQVLRSFEPTSQASPN